MQASEPSPSSGAANGFSLPKPVLANVSTPAPFKYGIDMTAELAFKGFESRGLLSSSHDGRLESSAILFETEIGRSNIVK